MIKIIEQHFHFQVILLKNINVLFQYTFFLKFRSYI